MRLLNILAAICSVLCVLSAAAESDTSEAIAWGIIALHNIRDIIDDRYK